MQGGLTAHGDLWLIDPRIVTPGQREPEPVEHHRTGLRFLRNKMGCYFFFSYATGDDTESTRHKRQFFDDLVRVIGAHRDYRGEAGEDLGFLDADIPTGSTWEPKIAGALRTCRVFVYLQEEAYFNFASRPYCGKEWHVFRDRLNGYTRNLGANAEPPALMIPIIWQKLPKLPPAAGAIQFKARDLGEPYDAFGAFLLKTREDWTRNYANFLSALARHIVTTANAHPLPPAEALPDFDGIENPFPVSETIPRALPVSRLNAGPRYVDFVYAVASKNDLCNLRAKLDAYDENDDPKRWKPCHPPNVGHIARIAEETAYQNDLTPDRLALDPHFGEAMDQALRKQRIVILIVDPWSLLVGKFQDLLRTVGEKRYWNSVVLLPWCDDPVDQGDKDSIQAVIDDIFFDLKETELRPQVTAARLVDELKLAFQRAGGKILRRGNSRKIAGPGPRALPGLSVFAS